MSTNDGTQESVCPITHAQLTPGEYSIVYAIDTYGIEFGRNFNVVNTQVTTTLSTTLTGTATVTPTSTSVVQTTVTLINTYTAKAETIVKPPGTTHVTITPRTTTTKTIVRTVTKESIVSTVTARTTKTRTGRRCASPSKVLDKTTKTHGTLHNRDNEIAAKTLAKRDGPDGPLTTTIIYYAAPSLVLITAPATTTVTTLEVDVVSTTTLTPSPVTAFGSASAVALATAPTITDTFTIRQQQTTTHFETSTVTYTIIKQLPCQSTKARRAI